MGSVGVEPAPLYRHFRVISKMLVRRFGSGVYYYMIILGKADKKREKLIENGKKYECSECHILPEWNSKMLVLHIDHINGDRTDNHINNLRFLCPNCHSQTKTYCAKNRVNKCSRRQFLQNMTKDEMEKMLASMTYEEITDKHGIPPQVLSKFLKENSIIKPKVQKLKEVLIVDRVNNCEVLKKVTGRNKVVLPEKIFLTNLVSNYSMKQVGSYFGVSDNAVRKWCKKYEIDLSQSWGLKPENYGKPSPNINGT